ncbi:helix-turn-helix transcriptional regulator [Yoonia sediminilitoris]|uniref:Regulatory LuxR family protein n=1 Tax=Yoonia sediminilitoris TaxID=1286148 RepID=A0A2T6KK85_9RHOB|nr:autoinducer binding domain-containing protein [Yoonia sediminilitoris]PUB16374.1 regulatory LuxR family protein [Yoonia sediminilitoris]RCW96723.1 regulatory LuxR family protein [Yoonia sediminilitoris]
MLELDQFLQALEAADALEQIQGLIVALRDSYEIDHVVYHWISADGEPYGFGTFSAAWAKRYTEMDYLRIDPVIVGCFRRFDPVDWRRLDWSSKAARAFSADAIAHGIGNQGFSIPIRGPNGQLAVLTASHTTDDDSWSAFMETHRRDFILIAHYLNNKALQLEKGRAPEPIRTLSPRETDALTYLGMGYSRGQVADLLSISEHTLRAYIESARFKLSALNTTHAVARAITEGLIIVGGSARAAQGQWPGRDEEESDKPKSIAN